MTWTPSTPSLPPGSGRPTPTSARSTGSSPPPTPESSSATYTQTLRGDGLLVVRTVLRVTQIDRRRKRHDSLVPQELRRRPYGGPASDRRPGRGRRCPGRGPGGRRGIGRRPDLAA